MTELKNLEGFLNALDKHIEGADTFVSDAQAFLGAVQQIERLFEENWPALESDLRNKVPSNDEKQRLLLLLETINSLESKTRARLAWSEDFEAHMQRAMETISLTK